MGRGLQRPSNQQPLIITDLPFLSYQCGVDQAVAAAGQVLKNSPASAVKLEGGEPETLAVVDRLVRSGIPVMGHLGLTPQSVHRLGYRRQANDPISQERLKRCARGLQAAGCFSLVLEHVPAALAGALEQGRAEGRLLGRQSQQVGGDAHLPVALLTGADANDRDR